ncbi:MAG: hypothetical protein HY010_15915 [Acidobacteria bacterium]|nr:hypothetical protein [Acidobacteriota bacterium]
MIPAEVLAADLPPFDRIFLDGAFRFTRIGTGSLGGKATGLAIIKDALTRDFDFGHFPDFDVDVPTMAVIATDFFDAFIPQNHLADLPIEQMSDDRIGHAFQQGDLPVELLGDLRALIEQVKSPLAIRSSSLLEDARDQPFAGVYGTKMIPNNQFDADSRFRRLVEAIKFVYASTYFREARSYIRATGQSPSSEKMAVIIQEVVGHRHGDRYYPDISGVARSYNFYANSPARPEDGVVSLALGLGKTIVDGDLAWTYSPAYPKKGPPFSSIRQLLRNSQTQFWAVNMGKPPAYDPVNEVEYLVRANLTDAEGDEVLEYLASTYDTSRDRVVPGIGTSGPRILNFAPLLVGERLPLNALIQAMISSAERVTGAKVEIEFAVTIHQRRGEQPRVRFGYLQVRPIAVSDQLIEVSVEDLHSPDAVISSDMALGNGVATDVQDIVYARPEHFSSLHTQAIAEELGKINRELVDQGRPYVLIGFGRIGSSHASLGIPSDWSQISGARVLVESTLPEMDVEPSQGSHFFHNLASFHASYFTVRHDAALGIDWDWLNHQPVIHETDLVRHVRPTRPLIVRVDGRNSRGVVLKGNEETARGKQ